MSQSQLLRGFPKIQPYQNGGLLPCNIYDRIRGTIVYLPTLLGWIYYKNCRQIYHTWILYDPVGIAKFGITRKLILDNLCLVSLVCLVCCFGWAWPPVLHMLEIFAFVPRIHYRYRLFAFFAWHTPHESRPRVPESPPFPNLPCLNHPDRWTSWCVTKYKPMQTGPKWPQLPTSWLTPPVMLWHHCGWKPHPAIWAHMDVDASWEYPKFGWCFMVSHGVSTQIRRFGGSLHSRGNNHHEAPEGWLQQQQPSQLTTNNYRYTLKTPQIQRIYDCGAADVLLALIHSVGLKVTHTLLKVKVIPDWLCRNLACLSAPPSWCLSIEKRSSNIDSCGAGDFHLATFHFEDDKTSWCPACSDPQAQGSQRAPESHFQHPTSWFFNIARWNWTSRQSWSIARRDSVRSNFSGEV